MKTARRADIGVSRKRSYAPLKGAAAMSVRYKITRTLSMAFAVMVSLSSCQEFFTSSLATGLRRPSYNIPADMSVADASALLDEAMLNGDADMAAALVTPLYAAALAAMGAAYEEAANALLDAAVLSSGVNAALTDVMNEVIAGATDIEAVAIAAIAAVSLSDEAAEGLILIADFPPADLSVEDAYAAAAALLAYGAEANSVDITDWENITPAETAALDADPAVSAAIELLHFASDNAEPGSIFADLPTADLLAQLGLVWV
jgi:hypothetical protein